MNCIVFIATSLDGFIATEDGGVEWLNSIPNPEGSDYGWSDFNNRIDAILLGRKTFEVAVSFGVWLYEKPVHVLSSTLDSIPDDLTDKAILHRGTIQDALADLVRRGVADLYVDGGKLIQSLLREDLIDEMIINRVPIFLGNGIPLFKDGGAQKAFIHLKTDIHNNSMVMSHYRRQPD